MQYRYCFTSALLLASLHLPILAMAAKSGMAKEERPVVMVEQDAYYKVVYDIHSNDEAAGINRGLYYARGLVEAFGKQGVRPEQLDIHLVLHSDAIKSLLVDETWQEVSLDPFSINPNAKITQDLLDLGVKVEICHSAMRGKGWKAEDVLPGVTIVHDGYTRLVKLQNDGYALIGGF